MMLIARLPWFKKLAWFVSFMLCVVLMPTSFAADKKHVVASFSILADIVKQVGQDRIDVTTLIGPDQDAHVFQVTPEHIKQISRADLVVMNGLGFEGWQERVLKSTGYRGDVVVASRGIENLVQTATHTHDHDHGHDHSKPKSSAKAKADPHAWQDPRNVIVYTRNIAQALTKLDPAGREVYQKNAEAYIQQLSALDRWAEQEVGRIPVAKRQVITSHDAFNYLGKRYQIKFLSPQGLSTDSEPSARDVANLIRQIRKQKIKAVFVENMSSPRLIAQINQETGTQLGGKLYADALSKADGPAKDYEAMMRFNIEQLVNQMTLN
jgi:zinc/manganese transport system substrate-binding protein